jgi:hypothetical protein
MHSDGSSSHRDDGRASGRATGRQESARRAGRGAHGDWRQEAGSDQSLALQAAAQRNVGNFQINSDVDLAVELPDKYMKSETASGGMMNMANTSGFNGDRPLKSVAPAGIGPGGAMVIRMGPAGSIGSGEKPTPEQQQQIDRQMVRSARQEISRLMLGWFATAHPAVGAQYTYGGEAESPDGKAHVIDVKNTDGFAARLFIDEKTALPLMVTYQGPQPRMVTSGGPRLQGAPGAQGPRQLTDEERKKAQADAEKQLQELQSQPPAMVEYALYFDDWRDVEGIKFPHAFRRAMAGATTEEWTISRIKLNGKLDPRKFEAAQ